MGLNEKRLIQQIATEDQAQAQQALNEGLGAPLEFVIDVASFPENAEVLACYQNYRAYGPLLVAKVLASIASDAMGRDAIRAKISKVVFRNSARAAENPGDKGVELRDGVLTVTCSFYGYSDRLFGEEDLKSLIEAML